MTREAHDHTKIYNKASSSLHSTRRYIVEWHTAAQEVLDSPLFKGLDEVEALKKAFLNLKNHFHSKPISHAEHARMASMVTKRAKHTVSRIQEYMRIQEKHVQAKAGYEAACIWKSLVPSIEFLKRRIVKCQASINLALRIDNNIKFTSQL